jgi:hypothetical protein
MTAVAKAKALIVAVGALLFYFINSGQPAPKDPRQIAFENWLQPVQLSLQDKTGERSTSTQPISIQFVSSYAEFPAEWKLIADGAEDRDRKVLRILELAREGEVFALPPPPGNQPSMSLNVARSDKAFTARFTRTQIEGNLQAQAMLKLLEVYAAEAQTPLSLTQP